ncbi:MAG: UDP-N-acetylmuramate--L-alanine ligase [Syntrophales bacterium]|nr:UDP-N-acetylmuramate--L-alanine ligase [Syntrophales bacterium]
MHLLKKRIDGEVSVMARLDAMRRKVKHIHFVGIGGIGMSGIAEVLLNLGYQVTGSDLNDTEITRRLKSLGATVYQGHNGNHLSDADVVVISTAVRPDNPEVIRAHERGIPVIPRAEMLAELLKMKFSIAVSGSHGKTTTTSMIATVLATAGLDPTMVIGGKLGSIGSNARLGSGEVIVAEADESDGSFLKLGPCLAVITNIDREHLDYYRDIEEIKEAFLKFANIVPFYGATVICSDDGYAREIIPQVKRRLITYGMETSADYRARQWRFEGGISKFNVYHQEEFIGEVTLHVPGRFNVLNALAAMAVARELDIGVKDIVTGLANFRGVQRRLEVKGKKKGIIVVDDYGHHPTEIRETLAAARELWGGRMIVVFQPHRYSRTKALYRDFLTAFDAADLLIVTDIYPASEDPIAGVNSASLCNDMRARGKGVVYISDLNEVTSYLLKVAKTGDVIITQGAGNVWSVGDKFLKMLEEDDGDGTKEED